MIAQRLLLNIDPDCNVRDQKPNAAAEGRNENRSLSLTTGASVKSGTKTASTVRLRLDDGVVWNQSVGG